MRKNGFTIVELLLFLAVSAITLAVGVPAILRTVTDLKMAHLDLCAQEIYLSAQHYLCELQFFGRSSDAEALAFDIFSDENYNYSYILLSKETDFMREQLGFLGNGSAILEYKKPSAAAAVYYSESMDPSELAELYLVKDLSDTDVRRTYKIGYHGGDPSNWKRGFLNDLEPEITVHNGEDLFLEVKCPDVPEDMISTFNIKLYLIADGHQIDCLEGNFADGKSCDFLIDSIETPFAEKFPTFTNCTEITARAEIIYSDGTSTSRYVSDRKAVTFDPMFESRGVGVSVSKVRHLNNLRYICRGGKIAANVMMTSDIDFNNSSYDNFIHTPRELKIKPLPELSGSFSGGGNMLLSPNIKVREENSGIFEAVSGSVKDLHVVGGAYKFGEGEAGIICNINKSGGKISGCTVSECGVTLGSGAVFGGIAGRNGGEIAACSAIFDRVELGSDGITACGIAGQNSGKINVSHTGGVFASSGKGLICGISAGGGRDRKLLQRVLARIRRRFGFLGDFGLRERRQQVGCGVRLAQS